MPPLAQVLLEALYFSLVAKRLHPDEDDTLVESPAVTPVSERVPRVRPPHGFALFLAKEEARKVKRLHKMLRVSEACAAVAGPAHPLYLLASAASSQKPHMHPFLSEEGPGALQPGSIPLPSPQLLMPLVLALPLVPTSSAYSCLFWQGPRCGFVAFSGSHVCPHVGCLCCPLSVLGALAVGICCPEPRPVTVVGLGLVDARRPCPPRASWCTCFSCW